LNNTIAALIEEVHVLVADDISRLQWLKKLSKWQLNQSFEKIDYGLPTEVLLGHLTPPHLSGAL
jgi:hypothetical protein